MCIAKNSAEDTFEQFSKVYCSYYSPRSSDHVAEDTEPMGSWALSMVRNGK
jgi:hypothetical protein